MPRQGVTVRPLLRDDPVQLGAYRLTGRLGSGGMGRIYLARSTPGGQLAAVKTLLAEGPVSSVDRRRFAREIKVARRVTSACTARVLDADADAERPWMAIEYVPAPSLAELVRIEGPPGVRTVQWIAAGSAAALTTLHRAGVVHRDLKCQNILLPAGGVRLIDFGISHATDLTRTQLTLGTIAFTSPEQARGEPSSTASDVYSLGATLFYLATGRPPYAETGDPLRLLAQVARGSVDLTGLSQELIDLIRPCLALDPGHRPQPEELLGDFTRLPAPAADGTGIADGTDWVPANWAEMIGAYERQGRELAARGGGTTATTAVLTGSRPAPPQRPRPAPSPPPAHRVAGLTGAGWRAAGSFTGNLLLLVLFGLVALFVVGLVVALVVVVALG